MRLAKGDCVLDCPSRFLKTSFCASKLGERGGVRVEGVEFRKGGMSGQTGG